MMACLSSPQYLAVAGGSQSPVLYDSSAQALSTASATCSTNYASSGANRALFVGVYVRGDGGASIIGVTCDGVSMTELFTPLSGSSTRLGCYAILAPPTSSVAIVATHGDIASNIGMTIISMTNVNQTTGWGTAATATGTTTSPATATVASVGSNDLVVDAVGIQAGGAPTADAGQTDRQSVDLTNANFMASSTQLGADGGVMSWTLSSPDFWKIGAVAFKPV